METSEGVILEGATLSVGFDIGGTTTKVACVEDERLCFTESYPTPKDPEEGIRLLVEHIKKLTADGGVRAVCGGVPGTVEDGVLVFAPNLPEWNGTPVAKMLSDALGGVPVTLLNDAELVGLGEYHYGAGKGFTNMLYVTVSTGVGGAHIVNGHIERGQYNIELGHQNVDGEELENLISGTAVFKKYGIHPKNLTDISILNSLADTLAKGLYDSVLHFSPEAIVLGGSMITGNNAIPVERVRETLEELVRQYYPTAPEVKKASLDIRGGLYGAMAYLQR